MADIFHLLKLLKEKLEILNGQPMSVNRDGLADTTQAQQIFINHRLIPKPLTAITDVASLEESTHYANRAIQAIWNASFYGSKGFVSGLANAHLIAESGRFLDESKVPKIIDEKTYSLGKILESFFIEAQADEILNEIPTMANLQHRARTFLVRAHNLLAQRLLIFETHTVEHVESAISWLQFKSDREGTFYAAQKKLTKHIETFQRVNTTQLISTPNKALEQFNDHVKHYEEALEVFRIFINLWHTGNLNNNLPECVNISNYIVLLRDTNRTTSELSDELGKIYNVPNYAIWPEKVGTTLNQLYNFGLNYIAKVERETKIFITRQQKMLQTQIDDAKLLVTYEQKLKEVISQSPQLIIAESIQQIIDNLDLLINKDIAFHDNLVQEIKKHQTEMMPHKYYLESQLEHFDSNHPLPQINELENKPPFEQAFSLTKKELSSKLVLMKQQETILLGTLQHINNKKQSLVDDLLKQTQQGRKEQIDDVSLKTKTLFEQMQESGPKAITESFELKHFLKEEYESALKEIHARFSQQLKDLKGKLVTVHTQLESKKEELLNHKHQSDERIFFLNAARDALLKFKKILEEHPGIYIPSAQVPKDALKNYLECDKEISDALDTIYATEKTGTGWYGFNRTNIYNKYTHYTSILKASDFDYDLNLVIGYIESKIDLIGAELTADLIGSEVKTKRLDSKEPVALVEPDAKEDVTVDLNIPSLSTKTYLLSQNNLWFLHNQYKKQVQEIHEIEQDVINPQSSDFLTIIQQQSSERLGFLATSRKQLIQFKKDLDENQTLYIPAKQIPQEDLKKLLECDNRIAGIIDEVYSVEKSAHSWLGFNRSNFYNKWAHYTSLGPSDFDYDISIISDYISEKIELIDAEMQVDLITGEAKTDVDNDRLKIDFTENEKKESIIEEIKPQVLSRHLLGEKNQWFFYAELTRLEQEKIELETVIQTHEQSLIELQAKKTAELSALELRKTEKEQTVAHASLTHQLNTLAHRQSLIALNSYELEFKLADFETKQNYLDGIVLSLETMEPSAALVFLEQLQDSIAATEVDKLMSQGLTESSGTELQKRIDEDMNLQIKELDAVKQLNQTITNKSEPMMSLMAALEINISTLNNKKTYLSDLLLKVKQTHDTKIKAVNTNKDLLVILNKLIDVNKAIQTYYPNLMVTDIAIPKNKSDRKQLIQERKQFIANYFEPILEFKKHPHERIKEYYAQINSGVNRLKDQIALLHLENVHEDSKELLKRFSLDNRSGRKGLYEALEQFMTSASVFLKKQDHSINKSIKKKVQAISANIDQIDIIKNILAPSSTNAMNLFQDGDEHTEELIEPSTSQNDLNISTYYFGTESCTGIFSAYLNERAKTFWFQDFCRSLAVFTFGCFGYKTDATERKEYITALQKTYEHYKDDENQGTVLLDLIHQGQKQFSPRAPVGQEGHNKSLFSILESFKLELKLTSAAKNEGHEAHISSIKYN